MLWLSPVYSETTKTEAFDAQIIKKRVEEKAIKKKEIKNSKLFSKIKDDFNLGDGEAEAIAFCLENETGLITDDKKAMKVKTAREFWIPAVNNAERFGKWAVLEIQDIHETQNLIRAGMDKGFDNLLSGNLLNDK